MNLQNIWFTSDTHFGHRNILNFEYIRKAAFNTDDIAEHDELIVQRWNAVVRPDDRVYHLGDVSFNKSELETIMPRLNGSIRLVMGNHDEGMLDRLQPHFRKVSGARYLTLTSAAGKKVRAILSHVPVHASQLAPASDRAVINIHGHLHSGWVPDTHGMPDYRYMNVCLEHHAMAPVRADHLFDMYNVDGWGHWKMEGEVSTTCLT